MVYGWSIWQAVEAVLVILFAGFVCAIPPDWMKDLNEVLTDFINEICWIIIGGVFLFLLAIPKDIASLVIISANDCNIDGGNSYVSFDVNSWLKYGSICHLSVWVAVTVWMCVVMAMSGCGGIPDKCIKYYISILSLIHI